jgi:hypothetical protein
MPLPNENNARITERVLMPGATVTLFNPVIAVESTDVLRRSGFLLVDTSTTYVEAGNYKVAFADMLQSHPTLTTGRLGNTVRELAVSGTVADEDGKPLGGVGITILRKTYAKEAEQPKIQEIGTTKTDSMGRFEIKSLHAI